MAGCPECGAVSTDQLSCWEMLGGVLAWESDDPELQAEHFLTVASYNLQHPAQFTDDVIAGLRQVFIDHLDQGVSVAEIRRRVAAVTEGNTRVRRPVSEQIPALRVWTMTVADVYIPDQPRGAAARVRRWAAAIRSELGGWGSRGDDP